MSPIELLSNSNRLPTPLSSIYEPNLIEAIMVLSNNTPEYLEYLNKGMKNRISLSSFDTELKDLCLFQISELTSEPLPVCQFHVIEVK